MEILTQMLLYPLLISIILFIVVKLVRLEVLLVCRITARMHAL